MAVPVVAWLSQSLVRKLGVGIGIEFASQLAALVMYQDERDPVEYDMEVRGVAIKVLLDARNEIKNTLFITDMKKMDVKQELFLVQRQINAVSDKIRYSDMLRNNLTDVNQETISYLNIIILSRGYALLKTIRQITDELEIHGNQISVLAIKSGIREIEQLVEIRNMMLTLDDRNVLNIISEQNPEVFMSLRSLASVVYKMEEMKKPMLYKAKYYERVQNSVLYMVDDTMASRGSILSLSEFYKEFQQTFPNMEVSLNDFEKSVNALVGKGMLETLETTNSGYKIVKLRPLKMTESYQQVVTVVSSNLTMLEKGVTREELAETMNYDLVTSEQILEELSKDDVAWRHEARYYFPGLAESAYQLKMQEEEVARDVVHA